MKTNFTKSLAMGLLCLPLANMVAAQSTVISFDDVVIPDTFPSLSKSMEIIPDEFVDYTFVSAGVSFSGSQAFWGNFTGFDCFRGTDSVDGTYANDVSAIAAIGYDESDNYAVVYATQMFPASPEHSHPIGFKLNTDTAVEVLGAYFTNTTLTYRYIAGNWENMSSYQVIIKGYKEGVKVTDSITFDLAKKTEGDTILVRDWTFASFAALGKVDSLTFEVFSDDITTFTPFYFAFDNIVLKDPPTSSINTLQHKLNITIVPNPATDFIQVLHPESNEMVYHIFSINGQRMASGNAGKAINVQNLPSGNYIIQVLDRNRNYANCTFVKQ